MKRKRKNKVSPMGHDGFRKPRKKERKVKEKKVEKKKRKKKKEELNRKSQKNQSYHFFLTSVVIWEGVKGSFWIFFFFFSFFFPFIPDFFSFTFVLFPSCSQNPPPIFTTKTHECIFCRMLFKMSLHCRILSVQNEWDNLLLRHGVEEVEVEEDEDEPWTFIILVELNTYPASSCFKSCDTSRKRTPLFFSSFFYLFIILFFCEATCPSSLSSIFTSSRNGKTQSQSQSRRALQH